MFNPIGPASTLPPYSVSQYNAVTDYFGTTSGEYRFIAYYMTAQGYWIPVPSSAGPSGSMDVFVP